MLAALLLEQQCLSVGWLTSLVESENVSTAIVRIDVESGSDVHVSFRKNYDNFGDPLTFHFLEMIVVFLICVQHKQNNSIC